MTPEQYQEMRTQREMFERNKPLTDEELDALLPGEKEGYKVGGRLCRWCSWAAVKRSCQQGVVPDGRCQGAWRGYSTQERSCAC
jgi:hypothetical protein